MPDKLTKKLNSIQKTTPQSKIDALFEVLYSTYSGLLGFILSSYDLPSSIIKDIINDSFFKLYQNRGNVRDVKYFLISVAKNTAINELHRHQRFVSLEDYSDSFMTEDMSNEIEAKLIIEKIMTLLNDEEKRIFNLYAIENMTSAQVGKRMNMNPNTIRTKWNRILKKIKGVL